MNVVAVEEVSLIRMSNEYQFYSHLQIQKICKTLEILSLLIVVLTLASKTTSFLAPNTKHVLVSPNEKTFMAVCPVVKKSKKKSSLVIPIKL